MSVENNSETIGLHSEELDSLQPLNLTVPSSFEVTESEGTEPKVTESEVTKSKVTESKATESEVTQSNIPELKPEKSHKLFSTDI
jgi:3-deoxy-D-arabino-heptulosonate 7-phosphate (DAHP) synthase class II